MNNRMIAGAWLVDTRIRALPHLAELLLFRATLVMDDFNICPADPAILRSMVWPGQSGTRLPDMARLLSALEAAGLIAAFEHDGQRYIEIKVCPQRLKIPKRGFPAPPWSGQAAMAPPSVPLAHEPKEENGREEKREKAHASAALTLPIDKIHKISEAEKLNELAAAYPGIDISKEHAKALTHLRKTRGPTAAMSPQWFEKHWLPNCAPENLSASIKPKDQYPEPDGDWLGMAREEFPTWVHLGDHGGQGPRWSELDDAAKSRISQEWSKKTDPSGS